MVYDASNPKHIKAAAKQAKTADLERRAAIESLMFNPAGRKWVWELLKRSHIFSTSYTGDPTGTLFAEGERNVGLSILSDITSYAPDQYIQMTREAQDKEQADGRRDSDNGHRRGEQNSDGRDNDEPGDASSRGDDTDGDEGSPEGFNAVDRSRWQ